MKIEYKFVNGETVRIEVSGNFEEIMLEMDRELKNNNRKETRRHDKLYLFDKDTTSTDLSVDLDGNLFKKFDKDKLYVAVAKLKPNEQELLYILYLNENPISQVELAKNENVSLGSIKMKLLRIKTKLRKLL